MMKHSVTWRLSGIIGDANTVQPCRQVYLWLVTPDGQTVVVSKDNKYW